jgi:UDP-glucose 4-epimerase
LYVNSIKDTLNCKSALITGGAGYIGSHLAEQLTKFGCNVVSLDNYLSGRMENHVDSVTYLEGDVNDILDILGSTAFDFIFHFGEYSRVEQSLDEAHLALSNTHKSFTSLLQYWSSTGAKLIYSGSSTKFSDSGEGRHLSPYTAAKALNTELLVDYAKWFDLPYVIVYFYNVFGGREIRDGKYATVIGLYKRLTKEGVTHLPVTEPGTQLRNFTHIDDIVQGILLAAVAGSGDGYGIGAREAYSILDVCKMFGRYPNLKAGSSANRMRGELRTEKIKNLGWQQKHELASHIRNFLSEETDDF